MNLRMVTMNPSLIKINLVSVFRTLSPEKEIVLQKTKQLKMGGIL